MVSGFCRQVSTQLSVNPPSTVVAVIMASPALRIVITPSASTVATLVSEDDQATVLYVASSGEISAPITKLSPT